MSGDGSQRRPKWRTVGTETSVDLYGAVQTVEGPYAVGESGTLAADRGDGWEIVFDDGPATRQAQLSAVDVTDDGRRIWMVGSSGVIACYDVEQRRKFDYSSPDGMTSTWEAVAVAGEKGTEKLLAANGSGAVLPFTVHGFDVDWGRATKPVAKGSNVAALAAAPDGVGYAVDTSGNAFRTSRAEGWTDIGILNAQLRLYDIWAGANQRVYVTASDSNVYRYDDSAGDWSPIGVADGIALRAVDVRIDDGEGEMVVVGGDGCIYERTGRERWRELPSPQQTTLFDVTVGEGADVLVGKNGTVIERPPEPRHSGTSLDSEVYTGRGENYDQPTDERRTSGAENGSGDTPGSPDGHLDNEELLTVLAGELAIDELSAAAGYRIETIEEAVLALARDVDANPERVRRALEHGPSN